MQYVGRLPSAQSEIFIGHIGSATKRVAESAMAYAHRDAEFVMNVPKRSEDAAQDRTCVTSGVLRRLCAVRHGGVYVNFLTDYEAGRIQAGYGDNYARLARLKAQYDPDNLFSVDQNI